MEADPVVKVEDIRSWIWDLPALGQARRHIQVIPARKQIVKNQIVDAFGRCINAHPRIEVGRAGLDYHHQRIRFRFVRAGKEGNNASKAECDGKCPPRDPHPKLMHTRSFPTPRLASPRSLRARSKDGDSMFRRRARRMLLPPSLLKAIRVHLRSATECQEE